MTNQEILVVAPAGWNQQILAGARFYSVEFSYVQKYPADGMLAWRMGGAPDTETVNVADRCRGYTGGFLLHALNRLVSQAMLRYRPRALVIVGFAGCTVDLPRVATLLGVPVLLILDTPAERLEMLDETTRAWLASSLSHCDHILLAHNEVAAAWPDAWLNTSPVTAVDTLPARLESLVQQPAAARSYDYSLYEFCQRDHPLLVNIQRADTIHFEGCTRVLDLACGVGIFLDCLRQQGIAATGVERDPRIAEYAKGMGLDVSTEDALAYLETTDDSFDGIYCSHFVEHLPFDAVQRLLQRLAERLSMGGVLVLVFPDPESIRSQLLGFWRDPEHVRFYHPELVISLAASVGLEVEWSSYETQPHRVVPFPELPPEVSSGVAIPPLPFDGPVTQAGWVETLLGKLGLVSERRFRRLEQQLLQWSNVLHQQSGQYVEASEQLEQRTSTLWDVNQTWAWNDNVTIRLRKRTE